MFYLPPGFTIRCIAVLGPTHLTFLRGSRLLPLLYNTNGPSPPAAFAQRETLGGQTKGRRKIGSGKVPVVVKCRQFLVGQACIAVGKAPDFSRHSCGLRGGVLVA